MTGRLPRYAHLTFVLVEEAAAVVVDHLLTGAGFHGPLFHPHGQLEVGVPSCAIHPL